MTGEEFRVVYRLRGDQQRFQKRKSRKFADALAKRLRKQGARGVYLERRTVGEWERV